MAAKTVDLAVFYVHGGKEPRFGARGAPEREDAS